MRKQSEYDKRKKKEILCSSLFHFKITFNHVLKLKFVIFASIIPFNQSRP